MLQFLEPDSPAIAPALQRAKGLEEAELATFYAVVVAQERAKDAELTRFYAAAAATEKAKQAELARFYAGVAAKKKADDLARFYAQVAANNKATAISMGDALVDRVCNGNGGEYQYWTSPPRAEVTTCYAPRSRASSSGNSGRTGAMCRDGTRSSATGSGACSWHGGVWYWLY